MPGEAGDRDKGGVMEGFYVAMNLSALPPDRFPEALGLAYEALRREIPREGYRFRCEGWLSSLFLIAQKES